MHDFEVSFQFGTFCHIYRGAGKSELRLVFLNVPYGVGSKLVAWSIIFDRFCQISQESVTLGPEKWSFLTIFSENRSKTSISRVKTRSSGRTVKNGVFRLKWPIMAISGHFSQNQPKTGQFYTVF